MCDQQQQQQQKPCHVNATCTYNDNNNTISCQCNEDNIGDGFDCTYILRYKVEVKEVSYECKYLV